MRKRLSKEMSENLPFHFPILLFSRFLVFELFLSAVFAFLIFTHLFIYSFSKCQRLFAQFINTVQDLMSQGNRAVTIGNVNYRFFIIADSISKQLEFIG